MGQWQVLYPGMKLVPDSADARRWAGELGLPFCEAVIETNGHCISLVFSDLAVQAVDLGYAPFAVSGGGPDYTPRTAHLLPSEKAHSQDAEYHRPGDQDQQRLR